MKRLSLIVSLILFISITASSQGDTSKITMRQLSISGGVGLPYSPQQFPNYWNQGISFEIGCGISFAPGSLGYATVYEALDYNYFPFDNQGSRTGNSIMVITAMTNFRGTFSTTHTSFAPYFFLGMGVLNRTTDDHLYLGSVKKIKTGFAWQAGAGFEFPATETVTAFIEGKFVLGLISDPGFQYFPIRIGGRFKI